jgi:hypothetical protein
MYNLIQTVSTQTPKCFLSDLYPLLDITTILTFIVLILLFFILFLQLLYTSLKKADSLVLSTFEFI